MDMKRLFGAGVLLFVFTYRPTNCRSLESKFHNDDVTDTRYRQLALEGRFMGLMRIFKSELDYDYIVLLDNYCASSPEIINGITIEPHMIISHDFSTRNWDQSRHKKGLLMRCGWRNCQNVSTHLLDTYAPFVNGQVLWMDSTGEIDDFCKCLKRELGNKFLLLDWSSENSEQFYTCHSHTRRKANVSDFVELLRQRDVDIKGLRIITESDQLPPRSILYYDTDGNLQLEGFVANCITSFAERYDATLVIQPPLEVGRAVFYEVLLNKTARGLLDMPAIVTPYKNKGLSAIQYSYPLEQMDLCYMIPLPRRMKGNRIFTYIIDWRVMIVIAGLAIVYGILFDAVACAPIKLNVSFSNVVVNDKGIRVLLGQSFVMPKNPRPLLQYICFLLCYTSLIISTTYQAYLQSNRIHPALEKRVESYEDMKEAGLRIALTSQESEFLDPSIYAMHKDLFTPIEPYDRFLKLRESMDTRFVYPVSNTRWEVFNEQQDLFQRPLFYYSSKLCLRKQALLAVPLGPNLPYKSLFDQHLLHLRETGLLQYWISVNFYTMVRLNITAFRDLSTPEEIADAIELNDLKWIWLLYGVTLFVAFSVLMCELVHFHKLSKRP
ncbi:uncharacterized protein LOC133325307 [Musca vetustissima]|uniref:uncharacterized protein LOC133325307 n=1 Tax=Musca vetustissima TaxID=27455 RepID=UPI002AB73B56|nr:uncharacterized protein LOC133325307 [Musca vetustissima]